MPLAGHGLARRVSYARTALVVLGIAFALAGIYVASVDVYMGLGFLVVGAFLLMIPFMRYRGEE